MCVDGIKKLPNTRLHWSRSYAFFRSQEIMKVMSRNRFDAILRCLHLVDNNDVVTDRAYSSYDKLAKSKWLVEEHNVLYAKYWLPEHNLTVDEMMVKYIRKYSPIRQYMKAKPTQYGIKIWCLANAKSKYVQKMNIYFA